MPKLYNTFPLATAFKAREFVPPDPEVGVQVPVDTFLYFLLVNVLHRIEQKTYLFDIVLNGEMPEGDVDPFRHESILDILGKH